MNFMLNAKHKSSDTRRRAPVNEAGYDRPSILFSRDAANSSLSRAKRSWCALKFETRCWISSRSELFRFTGGSRLGPTMVCGIGGSTRCFFAKAIVSSTSASRSAFQLVILVSPTHSAYRTVFSASSPLGRQANRVRTRLREAEAQFAAEQLIRKLQSR
jgi:hypothetical protein